MYRFHEPFKSWTLHRLSWLEVYWFPIHVSCYWRKITLHLDTNEEPSDRAPSIEAAQYKVKNYTENNFACGRNPTASVWNARDFKTGAVSVARLKVWEGVNQASSLERAVLSVWNRGCVSSVVNDRGKVSSFRNVSCSEHYTVNRVKKKIILGFCKEFLVYLKHTNPLFFIIKPTRCTNFTDHSGMKHYTFQAVLFPIIRSLFTVHSAGPGWNCSSTLVLLESCLQTYMTYTISERTVNKLLMMDRETARNV
jgi:hypothetical protein